MSILGPVGGALRLEGVACGASDGARVRGPAFDDPDGVPFVESFGEARRREAEQEAGEFPDSALL